MPVRVEMDFINKVEKVWGAEYWVVNNDLYCMKFLTVNPGFCSSLHYHKQKDETFYIDTGVVSLEIEGEVVNLISGRSVRIQPGQKHKFWNSGKHPVIILEISTPHRDEDVVRLEESKAIQKRRNNYATSAQ